MGSSEDDGKMEGWLYLIRSKRFGLQSIRKRYFVLENNALNCFKTVPKSKNEHPRRTAIIDSCIRVRDNGRELINKNIFFIFTLYNSSNHIDQIKLGARSSEEAVRWNQSLMRAALKDSPNWDKNVVAFSKRTWQPFRLSRNRGRSRRHSVDWTMFSSIHMDPTTSDVIAPSPWTIFGCKNGLRLFKEADDGDFHGKFWDDHPAIMAIGVVDASSEAIFETVISLGRSRSEWDFCFARGSVIEHLDGHTDIIHKQLKDDWLPWGMRRRDLLLQRYWRREDDGTYVILYHSVFHENCKPQKGFIRACLKSGGYVISPVNQGRQSVVRHMLAIDWRFWKSYIFTSSAKYVTIKMLGRVAALRELFKARLGNQSRCNFSCDDMAREIVIPRSTELMEEVSNEESVNTPCGTASVAGSFVQWNDASDEFFDVPEQSDFDDSEIMWPSDMCIDIQDQRHPRLSTAADFVKKLQSLAVQRKGYIGLQDAVAGDKGRCNYGATLPKDPTCSLLCSWTTADPSTFLIRGETYLEDRHKIKATGTLMQMVAADWLKSDKREDDLGGRPTGIVQKYANQGGNEFFFIINIQVPGSITHNLAFYYMMDTPLEDVPLLESFVNGDDVYRNSRFKLIPYISKGSWIVKQSVGKKACLIGQALEINYFRGKNYLELGIDIGSSTIARGVVSLVLSYLNNLVIEMAFLIQILLTTRTFPESSNVVKKTSHQFQYLFLTAVENLANNPEELPEFLLGTCRLNHLDASKSIPIALS